MDFGDIQYIVVSGFGAEKRMFYASNLLGLR